MVKDLTSANASKLNLITIDDGARAEIQQALSQGLEVTVHESPIAFNGWSGSGYAIIDSGMGVGAYKISGGDSGSFAFGAILLGFMFFASKAALAGGLIFNPVLVFIGISFLLWVKGIENSNTYHDFNVNNAIAGMTMLLAFLGIAKVSKELASMVFFVEAFALMLGAP